MARYGKMRSLRGSKRMICVPVASIHDFGLVEAIDYLIRLDMLPPPGRQKRARHDALLGLALLLPSVLFVTWKVFTAQ